MAQSTPQKIISDCKALAKQFNEKLLEGYFSEVDEKIMSFADKAKTNVQQWQLLELSRNIKNKQPEMRLLFDESISKSFDLFLQGKLGEDKPDSGQDLSPSLSLVADEKLEEDIAVSSLARRIETRYNEDMYALNQRFSMLIGGRKIQEEGNPAGPTQFANALHTAIEPLALDVKFMVLFYKIFEKNITPQLGDLYAEINQCLINAGILPNLRYQVSKKESTGSHQAIPPQPEPENYEVDNPFNTGAQPAVQVPPGQQPMQQSMQQPVQQQAMQQQPMQVPVASFAPSVPQEVARSITPPDSTLPPEQYQQQLFGAIRTMQQAVARPQGMGMSGPATSQDMVNVINHAQMMAAGHADEIEQATVGIAPCDTVTAQAATGQQLQEQVNAETDKNITDSDADIIDLVGMIFEYMLSDEHLPDNVKAVLSYLHTPFLKIAFLDKEFFVQPQHPSRVLLNALAETGSKWVSGDGTSQFKAFPKIKGVVRRILMEFDNDITLIDDLLAEVREFNKKVEKNVQLLEQRAAEKAEGEDKLRNVKRLVNKTVKGRIDGKKLPSPIIVLLLHPWSEYLTFSLLRHGEESEDWKNCLDIMDKILWSITPKTTKEDKDALVVMQEVITDELQHAFNTIGYDQAKANKLLNALHELHMIALNGKLAQPATPDVKQEIQATAVGEEEVKQEESIENISAEEQELVEKLRMVEFGTWVEFDELEGQRNQRLKIAWFNGRTMHYMLVNRAGKQVAMCSGIEMARHMLAGNARIISGTTKPFFERALENIFARLHSSAA